MLSDTIKSGLERAPHRSLLKACGLKKEDVGKVVGKKGRTIMAIRELVSGAGSRAQRKVTVEVVD